MSILDLQGMESSKAPASGGDSDLSVSGCNGISGLSLTGCI